MNNRAEQILTAIVQEYLSTGEAVGSKTLTQRYGVDLSPATVRSVMGNLEDLGLLQKPHTSAGRLPTEQGLRFFVNSLLQIHQLSEKEKDAWSKHYSFPGSGFDSVLKEAGKVLSELSNHTVIVMAPHMDLDVLSHIEFVRLPGEGLLAILVNRSGRVYNQFLENTPAPTPEELERIHAYLNQRMEGKTLSEIRSLVEEELASERTKYDALTKQALLLQAQALPQESTQVFVQGQAHLLGYALTDQESLDPERLKALFRALEDKRALLDVLDSMESSRGIQVFIGSETPIPELADCALVTTPYGATGQTIGMLGVIGPTRMDYPRILSLVDFTAQLLSKILDERGT